VHISNSLEEERKWEKRAWGNGDKKEDILIEKKIKEKEKRRVFPKLWKESLDSCLFNNRDNQSAKTEQKMIGYLKLILKMTSPKTYELAKLLR